MESLLALDVSRSRVLKSLESSLLSLSILKSFAAPVVKRLFNIYLNFETYFEDVSSVLLSLFTVVFQLAAFKTGSRCCIRLNIYGSELSLHLDCLVILSDDLSIAIPRLMNHYLPLLYHITWSLVPLR